VTQRESFYDADGRSARFRKQFRRHDDEEEHDFDDVEQEDLISPDSNKANTKPGDNFAAAAFPNLLADSKDQYTIKNLNNCLNTNIYSYLKTSGGQSSNSYLNAVHFFNTWVK
jgi:hypothetical protein